MSDAPPIDLLEPPDEESEGGQPEVVVDQFDRDRDLLKGAGEHSKIKKKLSDLKRAIRQGFDDQSTRSEDQQKYWNCYNCVLDSNQFYDGNAEIYFPLIHNAIEARATRFSNQLFPQTGQYVEAVDSDGESHASLVALLNHYVRSAKFKTQVSKPLCRNGDVEGQYNLYIDWNVVTREIVSRETHGPIDPLTGAEMPGPEIEDITEETVEEGSPGFEVLHDSDVLILPATANSVEDALASGGSVTIFRRWSKAKIAAMKKSGAIRKDEADRLMETMGKVKDQPNPAKKLAEHTGITPHGKEAHVWETWAMLDLRAAHYNEDDGEPRLCRMFFGPEDADLGCKRNPYWNDRCPLLSAPVQKLAGVMKGDSLISPVSSLQYEANDAANQGADAAAYSALPIVVRDPEAGNSPMVLNLAALWDVPPEKVKFMTFPDLTPRAVTRVQQAMHAIFETLGVNPAMLPQQTGKPGTKRNQAEIAMEQSVDLLTTSDVVTVQEEGIYTPACGWMVDLDYQFRDTELTVRKWGEMGRVMKMERVPPLSNRNGFSFTWRGAEQARQNAALFQQGTAWLNVVSTPNVQQALAANGKRIDPTAVIEQSASAIFGPVIASRVVIDLKDQLTIMADEENAMMAEGFEVHPHPLDDDAAHLKSHFQDIQQNGDPHGVKRLHMMAQLKQAQAKQAAAIQQQMAQHIQQQGGAPPAPPGAQGRPGPAQGTPQPGAAPAGPRLVKGPPGMIHPDALPKAGAVQMPRRF